jgi:uncharacterized protein
MTSLIITTVIGAIGGITALRLKVPAGAMVGAMLAVAIFNVLTGQAYMPQNVKIITQIAAGAFIGTGIRYKDVLDMRFMIKPAIYMVLSMIILDLAMGYIMYILTGIDLVTALFACAPGGLVDMSLISSDLGADSSKVAILQLIRLMSVMMIFPPMMKFISVKLNKAKAGGERDISEAVDIKSEQINKVSSQKPLTKEKGLNLALTSIVGLVAGYIGYVLKIPAGAMTFSMAAVGALNILFSRGYMPINLRKVTQIFAGILIGGKMTYADVISLKSVLLPAFILLIGIIIVNLCIGFLINKISNLELITSLLASAPGGLSDMALIAKDLGGDGPKVAILQLARYVCVLAFFPIIIKYISLLL